MRISFSTATFYHRSLRYSLRLARATGYDGVELALGPEYVLGGSATVERAVALEGLPVLSVHPPFLPLPGWPRHVVKRVQHLAAVTRDVHAEALVLHPPFLRGETSPRARAYTWLLELAREVGGPEIRICLESVEYRKRAQRYLLDDLETLVRFAQERHCGVTFDTCHAGANGQDLMQCYEIVRPVLGNVHLSDVIWQAGHPRTHVLPGEGSLPLRQLLAALARDGYSGPVTLEVHPREVGLFNRERQMRRLKQALDFVRSAVAKAAVDAVDTAGESEGIPA
jgi:sugar phosphate isomerase/epimerase